MEKLFDVEHFISGLSKKDSNEEDFHKLDRLCKKIDVVKEIYRFYTFDLAKKKTDKVISHDLYKELFVILSGIDDFKFLNSALKLNDIMCGKSIVSELEDNKNKKYVLDNINKLMAKLQASNEKT